MKMGGGWCDAMKSLDHDPLKGVYEKVSGQFITTSAKVTPNGGLVRESPLKWP